MEASHRSAGDKAILTTDYLHGGSPVCVSLWYHMNGLHIGSLKINITTNTSTKTIWESRGHKGDLWHFGQTSFSSTQSCKVSDHINEK